MCEIFCVTEVRTIATTGFIATTHTNATQRFNKIKNNNQSEATTHDKIESDLEMEAKEIPAELGSPDREADSSPPPRSEILLTLVRE